MRTKEIYTFKDCENAKLFTGLLFTQFLSVILNAVGNSFKMWLITNYSYD